MANSSEWWGQARWTNAPAAWSSDTWGRGGGAHPAGVGDPGLTCSRPTSEERRVKGAGKGATFTGSEVAGSDRGALRSKGGGSHPAGEGSDSHPADEVMLQGMIAAGIAEETRRVDEIKMMEAMRDWHDAGVVVDATKLLMRLIAAYHEEGVIEPTPAEVVDRAVRCLKRADERLPASCATGKPAMLPAEVKERIAKGRFDAFMRREEKRKSEQ